MASHDSPVEFTSVLYQGPLMAFDVADITMKVCCCVASLGTFSRIVDVQEISQMFLCLPSLLVILFAMQKFTNLKDDPTTLGMITGALIGVMTGFLSGIDKLVQPDFPDAFVAERKKNPVIYNLEILHIPVVLGSVMYAFCLVFDRLPGGNKLKWAGMLSLCGSVMCTMFRSLTSVSSKYHSNSLNQVGFFLLTMLAFFLLGLMPSARRGQQAWIICTVAWMLQLIWQSTFFDTLVWDWQENTFPIPGCLTAMIVVFFSDVLISLRTPVTLAPYRERLHSNQNVGREPLEPMLNAFLWHAVTFIVQKMSLYMIQQKNRSGAFIPSYTFESTITCLFSLFYLYIVSNNIRATPVMRITIILLGLTYYTIQGVTSLGLPNGLFIDVIFGLTIVYTIQIHHIDQINAK